MIILKFTVILFLIFIEISCNQPNQTTTQYPEKSDPDALEIIQFLEDYYRNIVSIQFDSTVTDYRYPKFDNVDKARSFAMQELNQILNNSGVDIKDLPIQKYNHYLERQLSILMNGTHCDYEQLITNQYTVFKRNDFKSISSTKDGVFDVRHISSKYIESHLRLDHPLARQINGNYFSISKRSTPATRTLVPMFEFEFPIENKDLFIHTIQKNEDTIVITSIGIGEKEFQNKITQLTLNTSKLPIEFETAYLDNNNIVKRKVNKYKHHNEYNSKFLIPHQVRFFEYIHNRQTKAFNLIYEGTNTIENIQINTIEKLTKLDTSLPYGTVIRPNVSIENLNAYTLPNNETVFTILQPFLRKEV